MTTTMLETKGRVETRPTTVVRTALPLSYTLVLAAVLVSATLYGLLVDSAYILKPGIDGEIRDVMRGSADAPGRARPGVGAARAR
jgi:hypothetical protein